MFSFSVVDLEEVEKIKEEHDYLHNNSDVFEFLLYEYLASQEKEKEESNLCNKLSQMEDNQKIIQSLLKEILLEVLNEKSFEKEIENDLESFLEKHNIKFIKLKQEEEHESNY